MRYSALAPGKRIRPALCVEVCMACGGEADAAIDLGIALELVHAFSLIHDDLPAIDNDALRRGRPTCHIQFGEAVAIMAGDSLFALAFETVAAMDAEPSVVVESMRILTTASGSRGLAGGETVDILSEGKPVDALTLDYIHRNKTGALIRAACELGAVAAGANLSVRAAAKAYGEHVGLAFQIADDLLNETATEEALGKAVGSDRERMKATYPAVHGIEASEWRARKEVELACAALIELPASKDCLRELAYFSIERLH